MKDIKINFLGFWNGFNPYQTQLWKILTKYYNPIICNNFDYLFCSCLGNHYDYVKFPQVRIMFSGENYIPDLNLIDYAISLYPLNLGDRIFQYPTPCPDTFFTYENIAQKRNVSNDIFKDKTFFCSFVASYDNEDNTRSKFVNFINQYKPTINAGKFLTNTNRVYRENGSKYALVKKCKFDICFEHTRNFGFNTEKIAEAFYCNTVPVYYGSESIFDIYNKDAFIYIKDIKDFDNALSQIIELDNNNELYLKMLNTYPFKENNYIQKKMESYERFILNIFEQPYEKAYRRSRVASAKGHENYLLRSKGVY